MTPEQVVANVAQSVEGTLEAGLHPVCARISVEDYKVLLARDGLEQRSIRIGKADSLRARAHGFDLPVDADQRVPTGDAWVWSVSLGVGFA